MYCELCGRRIPDGESECAFCAKDKGETSTKQEGEIEKYQFKAKK